MSDGEDIQVLHIDDDPDFVHLTADMLEREESQLTVETATSASDGLELLSDIKYDCIISDYDMPGMNGIEFLERVRDSYPDLPFILYTGKGTEKVASAAISAGVTDYLQKQTGSEQYELLSNRIENAVAKRRAQTNYQELFEKTPAGLTIHNPETGVIIDANRAFGELLGYEPGELKGKHPGELVPDESPFDRETADQLIQETIEAGARQFEWQDQTKGGDIIWVDVTLKRTTIDGDQRVLAVVQEVTDRKQREHELRQYETIIESLRDPVMVFDTEHRIQFANHQVLKDLGVAEDDLLGKPVTEALQGVGLFSDGDRDIPVREKIEAILAGDREAVQIEMPLDTENRYVVGHIMFVPLTVDGNVEGVVSIGRDITERKEYERELERQNDRLEEFASIVSHDLRNPLRVAEGRLELIQEECESEHTGDLAQALDRMDALIEDMLTLAREGEHIDETDSVGLAHVATSSWETVNTRQAALETDTSQKIKADQDRLQQLFENLYRNAVDHGGDDVTVSVETMNDGFYVADTGPGIPESDREDIFEAGYSTAEDGTGFGLRIVKQIVDAHGWEITVTESEECGARFEITDVELGTA